MGDLYRMIRIGVWFVLELHLSWVAVQTIVEVVVFLVGYCSCRAELGSIRRTLDTDRLRMFRWGRDPLLQHVEPTGCYRMDDDCSSGDLG